MCAGILCMYSRLKTNRPISYFLLNGGLADSRYLVSQRILSNIGYPWQRKRIISIHSRQKRLVDAMTLSVWLSTGLRTVANGRSSSGPLTTQMGMDWPRRPLWVIQCSRVCPTSVSGEGDNDDGDDVECKLSDRVGITGIQGCQMPLQSVGKFKLKRNRQ